MLPFENPNFDVVIAGAGAAGLYAALHLPPTMRILVLAKREATLCNSALAQGGIAGVWNSPDDNTELHANDTRIAGAFTNRPETLHILVTEAAQDIEQLVKYGVDFDRTPQGDYDRTLEGGHCRRRIFHHRDSTGAEILRGLLAATALLPNVTIAEHTMVSRAMHTETGFSCELLHEGAFSVVNCHFLIMATGGIGRVYEYTTNSAIATGDGIRIAYELGARIKNLSLIQFHPTAFNNRHTRECFLISEAVRGEGAYLRNCKMERFMHRYDDRLELAPRDVVSHAIIAESKRTGSTDFWLDISHKDPAEVRDRFPKIYSKLLEQGYDLTKEPVPIFPCQHYLMGGINVDSNAQTRVERLFACGECAHTGVHGSNRLASNSLLEALVFSRRAAAEIARQADAIGDRFVQGEFPPVTATEPLPHGIRTELRKILQENYFVVPNTKNIPAAYQRITELIQLIACEDWRMDTDYLEARSQATVAYLILEEQL
ncbi:MAG: FAD-binding protein [Oscillospiraceae bacterium]|nr:FAD-binding protein [Oscillospiraceae bacterium]